MLVRRRPHLFPYALHPVLLGVLSLLLPPPPPAFFARLLKKSFSLFGSKSGDFALEVSRARPTGVNASEPLASSPLSLLALGGFGVPVLGVVEMGLANV